MRRPESNFLKMGFPSTTCVVGLKLRSVNRFDGQDLRSLSLLSRSSFSVCLFALLFKYRTERKEVEFV